MKSPFSDNGKQHSPVVGFAFDGFPLYGPYESQNILAKDIEGSHALDVCNGHRDDVRGYHYHVTPQKFPYILGGYRGVPEFSNNPGIRRAGTGAIVDETTPGDAIPKIIENVAPGAAQRGSKHTITITLDSKLATSMRIEGDSPDWVQFGPFEAKLIARNGNEVTVEIDIPEDAAVGTFLDCHLELNPPAVVVGRSS